MEIVEKLIKKVRDGFDILDVGETYKSQSLDWLKLWLTDKDFDEYSPQIRYLIDNEKWDLLLDSFYQVIPFGTGGRRGAVGIGPNRINKWTIQASAQGHSQYLLKQYGEKARKRGIVLAYDVREFTETGIYDDSLDNPVKGLNGEQLAVAAAEVYAANRIKVYTFDGVRSTPELSFSIRHLDAVSGVMFSASHNPPSDNGKKVYDEFGGQLIPPYDQILVDEVTSNVKEIKKMELNEAKERDLIVKISRDTDDQYIRSVCGLSLSSQRDINIVYSPLHGTGKTSVWPVLKRLGFKVTPHQETFNFSGAFENATFNIPNPEVVQSFDSVIPFAEEIEADIIINSDPDADRIGVMVKHQGQWVYLNGNEIGILLTDYAIGKYQLRGRINAGSTIIKTDATTSLIETITRKNNVNCIGDLLVGFKYIAEEMNRLERDNKMKDFILGSEESHGFIMGNYCRDKDAAGAAIWICELAAELKIENKTLINHLDKIYATYGYCHNHLTEIRLLGATGREQISRIMKHLRDNRIENFTDFSVKEKIDWWQGTPQAHMSKTDTSSRNVLVFHLENLLITEIIKVMVRPSGTESKIKMYFEVFGKPFDIDNIGKEKGRILNIRKKLEQNFMQYCYKIINIDFPERGFLLFWQLPLAHKLRYFDIEGDIVNFKKISNRKKREEELYKLLEFLGTNPIEKIDDAFKNKYKIGILEYLNLSN